ncbi:hypothetical protein PHET_09186 [Paragonimus heterotremus]|uniref:Beta-1,3-galactosyl-O-glycosyl-glycoprotein beta-1,6-N-acetylglucosaminyltransferase n=1 Tax=Paragonimus heterotremus TaxID=100268 RepID=A0A8J4SL91_9TREM|nr:hypothetical protein PHET_09186 [Paragonimus heterotremus]
MSQVSLKMPKTVTNAYLPSSHSVRSNKAIELCILIIALCGLTYNPGQLSGFLTGHFSRGLENQQCQICEHSVNKANMWSVHTERPEELNFPLVYSIMVFTDLDRAVRLLKAICRPHNQYCIHVDRNTPETNEKYLRQAAMFLGSNILFVPSEKCLNVKWGTLSVLEAELLCAQLLIQADAQWKYWINLTGHEFPLKTNWEIVKEERETFSESPFSRIQQTPAYRDEFSCTLRRQYTCVVHCTDLEHSVRTVNVDSGLPNWLSNLLHVLQTPSVSVITQLLPSYQLPDTLLIQHIHLKHIALTWSLPENHTFPVPVRHVSKLTSQIKSIRAIVGCESVSITVNTASEAGSAGASTNTSPPGKLLMAFLSNATVHLCPLYTKTTSALPLLERFISQPSQFVSWLNSLYLTGCVCVTDLDHLEMRCFSDPVRITQTVSTSQSDSYAGSFSVS